MKRSEIKAEIKRLQEELNKEFELQFEDAFSDRLNIVESANGSALLVNVNGELKVRLESSQCRELAEGILVWLETVE